MTPLIPAILNLAIRVFHWFLLMVKQCTFCVKSCFLCVKSVCFYILLCLNEFSNLKGLKSTQSSWLVPYLIGLKVIKFKIKTVSRSMENQYFKGNITIKVT